MFNTTANVWGIFVGHNGDQLKVLNSKAGPFPPETEREGWIAIGYPALGDLRMFENNYERFEYAFEAVYKFPEYEGQTRQSWGVRRNQCWRFLTELKVGDAIVAPSSDLGVVLIGKVTGDYHPNFHNELDLSERRWIDLVHFRPVLWLQTIEQSDPRYSSVNRIGQLTLSKLTLTVGELNQILTSTN